MTYDNRSLLDKCTNIGNYLIMVILCSLKKKPAESRESEVELGKGMGKPVVGLRESNLEWAGG